MKSNPNARNICLETMLSESEMRGLTALSKFLGIPKSTLNRGLINGEVQRHGTPPAPPKESRHCRGAGRPANRASVGRAMVRRQV